MIRREIRPPVLVVFLPQIVPILETVISGVQTGAPVCRLVRSATVCEMASKDEHIARRQRHRRPLMPLHPRIGDVPALARDERNVHVVRLGDYLQAAVLQRGSIDGYVGCDVFNTANVIVRRGVEMRRETVAVG